MVRPALSLHDALPICCAWAATASAAWIVPLTVPGGNPVTAVPALRPTFPLPAGVAVVLTVESARTANVPADPRATGAGPADVGDSRAAARIGKPMIVA